MSPSKSNRDKIRFSTLVKQSLPIQEPFLSASWTHGCLGAQSDGFTKPLHWTASWKIKLVVGNVTSHIVTSYILHVFWNETRMLILSEVTAQVWYHFFSPCYGFAVGLPSHW